VYGEGKGMEKNVSKVISKGRGRTPSAWGKWHGKWVTRREGRSESERTNQPVTFAPEGTNRHHHFRGHLVCKARTRVHIYYIPDQRRVIDARKLKRKTFLFPKMSHLTAGV